MTRSWLPLVLISLSLILFVAAEQGNSGERWTAAGLCEQFSVKCTYTEPTQRQWVEEFFRENRLGAPLWPSGTNTTK